MALIVDADSALVDVAVLAAVERSCEP